VRTSETILADLSFHRINPVLVAELIAGLDGYHRSRADLSIAE
jgi:hypothetical protein